jgi:hypothetical protein
MKTVASAWSWPGILFGPLAGAIVFGLIALAGTRSPTLWTQDIEPDRWPFVGTAAITGIVLGLVFASRPVRLVQDWIARLLGEYPIARWLSGVIGFLAFAVGDLGLGSAILGADGGIPSFVGFLLLWIPIEFAVIGTIGILAQEPLTAPDHELS